MILSLKLSIFLSNDILQYLKIESSDRAVLKLCFLYSQYDCKNIEVFMNDLSVLRNTFDNFLDRLDVVMKNMC